MSFSKFGLLSEYAVGLSLKNFNWAVFFSRGSRGPADIVAKKGDVILLIQVKSTTKVPKIPGSAVKNLINLSNKINNSFPVLSLVQPNLECNRTVNTIPLGNYLINFVLLPNWKSVDFINK